MKKICLQAGHWNTTTSATGAPNEMAFNVDICNTVASELRRRGFEVKQTDANTDKDTSITQIDWDLFLAVHYDADIYNTGGYFVDYPEPSTDGATIQSQRIQKILSEEYGKTTGIVNHYERSNANTRYYYLWKYLSAKTPCNLIECGVGMHVPDDWQILHFDRPRVVEGIVRGICKAMSIEYDISLPPMPEPPQNTPSEPCIHADVLNRVHDIVWGKGFVWVRMNKLKELLPK
jgi:N-acetylmuramoyl-L-alanine amidase